MQKRFSVLIIVLYYYSTTRGSDCCLTTTEIDLFAEPFYLWNEVLGPYSKFQQPKKFFFRAAPGVFFLSHSRAKVSIYVSRYGFGINVLGVFSGVSIRFRYLLYVMPAALRNDLLFQQISGSLYRRFVQLTCSFR